MAAALIVFAAIHGGGLFMTWGAGPGAIIPYVSLTVGVLVWATRLQRMEAGTSPP